MAFQRQFSAGGVVFKRDNGKTFVVIYKPESRDTWQLPKGLIDSGEKPEETAAREVKEEAGVEGKVLQKLDTIRYFFNWEGKKYFKSVDFYLMEYVGGDPSEHGWEAETAEWVEIDKAIGRLTYKTEKEVVKKAKETLTNKNG